MSRFAALAVAVVGALVLVGFWPRGATSSATFDQARGPVVGAAWTIPGMGLRMQPIAAGTFLRGSLAHFTGSDAITGNPPQTRVTLTQPFFLGATEVTQAQWVAVMGSNPSDFEGDTLPVENVSHDDALAFCQKLTERERAARRLPAGYVYTLPTEAQWEYACRAGTTGDYAGVLDAMAWYDENSGGKTHPVGEKKANAWGLYDMHGNVWEWCLDWVGSPRSDAVTDPAGPASGSRRGFRGGSWDYSAFFAGSAIRSANVPGFLYSNLGFRLALAPQISR